MKTPARCVSTSSTVSAAFPFAANAGKYFATGAFTSMAPRSSSIAIAMATTGLLAKKTANREPRGRCDRNGWLRLGRPKATGRAGRDVEDHAAAAANHQLAPGETPRCALTFEERAHPLEALHLVPMRHACER